MKKRIYLDHAASTFVYPEIIKALPRVANQYGNPSSVHAEGRAARHIIDEARMGIAQGLRVEPDQIIFTSGGTEGVYLAMIGAYTARKNLGIGKGKILISPVSHSCMTAAALFLQKNFGVEIISFPITNEGFLDISIFPPEYYSEFDMIVTEHGNSELGLRQPVEGIGEILQNISPHKRPICIVDACASWGSEPFIFSELNTDVMILSGEKFGALKGTGMVIHRKGIFLEPLFSGAQEFGKRAGTENTIGIFSLGKAVTIQLSEKKKFMTHCLALHQKLRLEFEHKFCSIKILTPKTNFLPHIFSFLLSQKSGHDFVVFADLNGISISSGTACSSGGGKESRVLQSLGCSQDESARGVRISLGKTNTLNDIHDVCFVLNKFLSG